MSLAHKYVNLKETYNQDIKEQVTTKFLKKDRLYMKSPTTEAQCACIFKIQSPICGANFSNNISITQLRVNERRTNLTGPNFPLMHNLIISLHVKHPPQICPRKFVPSCKAFFTKKVSQYFAVGRGDNMLYLHIFFHF